MGALSKTQGKSLTIGVIPRPRTVDQASLEASVKALAVPMADHDFTQRTLNLWQSRTARGLTPEDARQMAANVSGFFILLAEWDRQARRVQDRPPADDQPAEK